MANYECKIRTNYFRVKDETAFRDLMSRVYGSEDTIDLWEKNDNGAKVFGFGCYGGISGLRTEDDDENDDFDSVIDELQKYVADDDAIIIFEVGNEKLRYLSGLATIITANEVKVVDLIDTACEAAANLLDNSNWKTITCY